MLQNNFQDSVVFRSASQGTLPNTRHHWSCPRWANTVVRGRPVTNPRRRPSTASSAPTFSSFPARQPPPAVSPDVQVSSESAAPAAAAQPSAVAAEPSAEAAEPSDGAARRDQLTEEALRQRIERVLVEMISPKDDDGGDESKVAAALRQVIVDSAAFPTLFTD